jgi:hypothetical protein
VVFLDLSLVKWSRAPLPHQPAGSLHSNVVGGFSSMSKGKVRRHVCMKGWCVGC